MNCEKCTSLMCEGSLGEKAWICTNNDCERSNPMWLSDEEKDTLYRLADNEARIAALSTVEWNGVKGKIYVNTVRFIGEGSGDLQFENGVIVFFIKMNSRYEFYHQQAEVIRSLEESNIAEQIEAVRVLAVDEEGKLLRQGGMTTR